MPKKGYNLDLLESAVQNIIIRETVPEVNLLIELKNQINAFFTESTCVDLIYTENTDNVFFGIKVMPIISNEEVIDIISNDAEFPIKKYFVEIDSKLNSLGLLADQFTAYLLYEISNMVVGSKPIEKFRDTLSIYFAEHNEILQLKDSTQYSRLLGFAIKDTLIKQNSILYKNPYEVPYGELIEEFGYQDSITKCLERMSSSAYGKGNTVNADQPLTILEWVLRLYKNVEENRIPALEILRKSIIVTGSKLVKREINLVIDSLQKIDTDLLQESTFLMEAAKKKNSLFKSLKTNGLRAIEDDLYEFKIRIKNADTEDDVMYTLRQINTRLTILSDYLETEDLSEEQYDRWHAVLTAYRDLREQLSSKKVYNKKNYGLWYSYNQMDDNEKAQSMY